MIVVMLSKFPRPGKVMTRIGKVIGMQEAAVLQRELLDLLIPRYLSSEFEFIVAAASQEDADDFKKAFIVDTMLQGGVDLGARMRYTISELLVHHEKVVLVGSDVPELTPAICGEAFVALDTCDVVLGPTFDGGYYLVGMKKSFDIFSDILYSTDIVLKETMKKADEQGLSVFLLEKLTDLDSVGDVESWRTSTFVGKKC